MHSENANFKKTSNKPNKGKVDLTKPRGTRDLYQVSSALYQNIIVVLRKCALKYNYQFIITPLFEDSKLFLRAVGETTDIVQKEIYQFADKKGKIFALRPEGTAGIVRAIIENKLYQGYNTLKYFYYGPMFRYERPQLGRQREFNQFGIESVGTKNPLQDVEIMIMAFEMVQKLELPNLVLKINYFGSDKTKSNYQVAFKKQLLTQTAQLCELCQNRIISSPLRILDCKTCSKINLVIPPIANFLTAAEKLYFNEITTTLEANNIAFTIDNKLVRGLDYYNGIIFEISMNDTKNNLLGVSQNTILGGGRYDNLFTELGAKHNVPAIGFALGIERLMLLLANNETFNKQMVPSLQIIACHPDVVKMVFNCVTYFRSSKYNVDAKYKLYKEKHIKPIIKRAKVKNLLFLINNQQAKFYSFKNQKITILTFKTCLELQKATEKQLQEDKANEADF